jgi:hypothetical protein
MLIRALQRLGAFTHSVGRVETKIFMQPSDFGLDPVGSAVHSCSKPKIVERAFAVAHLVRKLKIWTREIWFLFFSYL